jgi:DNA repair exonuclease SbcCD ATPase subunit
MIVIKRLAGFNFATYKRLDVRLDRQGVVSIEGDNKDTGGSNGSGKSIPWTLLLEFILFEKNSAGFTGDKIIGHHAKGFYGILYWEANGSKYKVIKWRGKCKYADKYAKRQGIDIFCDGKSIVKGNRLPEQQRQVSEVFGMTREEFLGSVLLGGEDHVLIKGQPSERISFLSGPFRLFVYDAIAKRIKEDLKELEERFHRFDVIRAKQERAQEELERLGSLREARAELDLYRKRLRVVEKKKAGYTLVRDEAIKGYTELKALDEKPMSPTQVKEALERTVELQEVEEKADKQLGKLNRKLATAESVEDVQEELEKLDNTLDADKCERRVEKLRAEITEITTLYGVEIGTIAQYKKFVGKKKCPTCTRPFDKNHRKQMSTAVAKAEATAESLTKDQVEKEKALKRAEKKLKEARKVAKLKDKLPDGKVPDTDELRKKIEALEEERRSARQQISKLTPEIERSMKTNRRLRKLGVTWKERKGQLKTYKAERKDAEAEIEALREKERRATSKIDSIESMLEERKRVEAELKLYEQRLSKEDKLRDRQKRLQVLEQAYGPRGLKLEKIRRIIKRFQDILPQFTSILFSERGLKFVAEGDDKKINFLVKRKKSKPFDVKGLSRGERRRANLAFILMVKYAMPSTKSTNLVILDEVDTNVDAIGRGVFVNDLLPMLKERIPTIVVISLNKDVSRANVFDQHWTAVKKDETSELLT